MEQQQSRPRSNVRASALIALLAAAALPAASMPRRGASAADSGRDALQQSERGSVAAFLPLALARHSRAGAGSVPTAAATAVPTDTPPPTATDTPEPTATPTTAVCGPLAERVRVTSVDVSPAEVQVATGRGRSWWPIYLAPLTDGGAKIAWSDTEAQVHVTKIDGDGRRLGDDAVVAGDEVRGLVAHTDGGTAMLVVTGNVMSLVRLDAAGATVFRKDLVGLQPQTVTGSKWVDSWGHEGRLVFAENTYAAYFGHTQFFGANGKHQGDLLWFFDPDGNKITREREGWDWGCSHSLDLRLAHNGTRFGPVCLSDAYPKEGFHFNHRETMIRAEPSGDGSGGSDARLGGWVPLPNGFLMSFASPEGRASTDVGLVHVSNDAEIGAVRWLTNSAAVVEDGPHLARYGRDQFLASWTADAAHLAALVKEDGTFIEGPVAIEATIGARNDMQTMPDGDVAWAHAWGDMHALKTVRVDACGAQAVLPPTPRPTVRPTDAPTPVGPTAVPTDGPSPTPRPLPTKGPQACTNVITNGNFEDGTRGWTIDGETGIAASDHGGGKFGAKLLGRNDVTSDLRQPVTVPRGSASAHLSYWWRMQSGEAATSKDPFDWVGVSVDGSTVRTEALEVLSNLSGRDGWRLSAYALDVDRTQKLIFSAGSNKRDASTFVIDDVQLIVCSGAPATFPSLSVDPGSGAASTRFNGSGDGFQAGEAVQHWAIEPGSRLRFDLGTAAAGDDGSLGTAFGVRATVGEWRWMAAGTTSTLPGTAAFRVTGAQ
ncbi:MAG: hypothetical protein IT332_00095 [Ardenticatenales bacterium]|nr:hypothetical protein [Ardenticatenales bacterium]